jgi:U3 small nucleolar RNA-associated protein 13
MSDYLKKRKRTEGKSFNKGGKFGSNKFGNKSDFSNSNSKSPYKNIGKFSNSSGGNKNKGFNVKINKHKSNPIEESITFDPNALGTSDTISEELIKIGKFWDGKTLIEPKNTMGRLTFIEGANTNNTLNNFTLSQVGDGLYILNSEDFSLLDKITPNEESIVSYTYCQRKNEIICSMSNSLVRVYDLTVGSIKSNKVWKLNKEIARLMRVDQTGKFLAIATARNNIFVYDTETYKLLNSFSGHSGFIYDLSFSPDKEKFLLYSASEDGTVKIWDILLNKQVGSLSGHSNGVRHLALTNDAMSLISVTADNNIYIWKLGNKPESSSLIKTYNCGKEISAVYYFTRSKEIKGNNNSSTSAKELTPTLLLGCEDGSLTEINLKNGKFSEGDKLTKFYDQPIIQMYYAKNSHKLNILTNDQMIINLDIDLVHNEINYAKLIKMYPGYCQELLDVKILKNTKGLESSANNKFEFLFSSNDNALKYYQLNKLNETTLIKAYEGHEDFIMNIEISGDYIATSSKDKTIRIWKNTSTDNEFNCKCIAVLKGHSEAVNASALMVKKGNKHVVSCGKDLSIKVWDFSQVNEEEILSDSDQYTHPAIIKESLYSEMAHSEEINLVKVSPNEKLIASGAYDKTIKIFSNDLKLLGTITGHRRAITDISFSKYAKLLASSSTDKTIKVWNLNDYSCINTFEGHLASALKVQWVYFGTHILSAGADGLVKFWNLKTSECLNTVSAHEGKIWALDVNEGNNTKNENEEEKSTSKKTIQFVTGGTDSKVILWTDVTAEKETETLNKEEDTMLKKEKLRHLNDDKEYYEAMKLALELNHRNDFINILKNYVNEGLKRDQNENLYNMKDNISIIINNRKILDEEEVDGNNKVNSSSDEIFKQNLTKILKDQELRKIVKSNINKILEITRDNNLRSANFLYVQILLKLLLVSTNYEFFFNQKDVALGKKNKKLKKQRKDIDYIENFGIIKSYSEKHLERINREITKSYLVDFVLEKMKII